jgi:hypothetical protein
VLPAPARIFAAALACAALLGACDGSPTGGGGGGGAKEPPPIAAGSVVTGQLAPGDTAAWYTVTPLPSTDVKLLLQARSGSASDTLQADLVDMVTGQVIAWTRSVGTDTTLARQASVWAPAPPAGARWRIRVHRAGADDSGAFSVELFPRNAAPEHLPAAISLGQTVQGESIDVPGDVDEFKLAAQAGQEVILFAQSVPTGIYIPTALVDSASGQVLATVDFTAPTVALEERSSGRVTLPHAGTYLVRFGNAGDFSTTVGGYRFRVDAVNRAPETAPAAQTMGAVVSETIGSVGDVDEFTFAGHAGQEMNLAVQLVSGMSAGMRVELLQGTQVLAYVDASTPTASLDEMGTGRLALPADGDYTIRISGPPYGAPATATGSYRIELYPVDRRPEVPGTVALDGPMIAGAIDRPGDVDEFPVTGTAGQLVVVHLTAYPVRGDVVAELVSPAGAVVATADVGPLAGPGPNGYSARATLPATGTYTLRVRAVTYRPLAAGPYAVEAYTINPAPEHVPATVHVGQTITGESIDRPGDLDVFTFTPDGRTFNLFLGTPTADEALTAFVQKADATLPSGLFTWSGTMSLDGASTGRLDLDDVSYTIRIEAYGSTGRTDIAGPYAFRLFPINRSPEGRSATIALGDTVQGEPLYPAGDVDTYSFDVAQTTNVQILWDAPYTGPDDAVFGLLSGPVQWNNFETVNGELVRSLTLPPGHYTFRVDNDNVHAYADPNMARLATLHYRFAFIPH